PHDEDEEGPRYPGTCRGLGAADVEARARAQGRAPSIRFLAAGGGDRGDGAGGAMRIVFDDRVPGLLDPLGVAGGGGFVLRRPAGGVGGPGGAGRPRLAAGALGRGRLRLVAAHTHAGCLDVGRVCTCTSTFPRPYPCPCTGTFVTAWRLALAPRPWR